MSCAIVGIRWDSSFARREFHLCVMKLLMRDEAALIQGILVWHPAGFEFRLNRPHLNRSTTKGYRVTVLFFYFIRRDETGAQVQVFVFS